MNEPLGTTETSMEAILASIRRIIAEDQIQPPPGIRLPPLARPEPDEQKPPPALVPDPPSSLAPSPSDAEVAPPAPFVPQIVAPPDVPVPPATPLPMADVVVLRPSSAPELAAAPEPAEPKSGQDESGNRAPTGEELVLTQMVGEDGSVVAVDKRGTPASQQSQPLDVLLLTDALPGSTPDVANAESVPRPAPPRPTSRPASDLDRPRVGLAAPQTAVTSAAVLEQLARVRSQMAASADPLAGALGAASLEDLVRQSLEPKIQEWLNANLLEIVERLVQQEIDKISRRT